MNGYFSTLFRPKQNPRLLNANIRKVQSGGNARRTRLQCATGLPSSAARSPGLVVVQVVCVRANGLRQGQPAPRNHRLAVKPMHRREEARCRMGAHVPQVHPMLWGDGLATNLSRQTQPTVVGLEIPIRGHRVHRCTELMPKE